jgi:hypothetical protein
MLSFLPQFAGSESRRVASRFKIGGPKMTKAKRGLDGRHRDRSGRIEKKHGNARIGALRKEVRAAGSICF